MASFPTIQTPDKDDYWRIQTASFGNQVPFYFGGSSVPFTIGVPKLRPLKEETKPEKPSIKINQQILRYNN